MNTISPDIVAAAAAIIRKDGFILTDDIDESNEVLDALDEAGYFYGESTPIGTMKKAAEYINCFWKNGDVSVCPSVCVGYVTPENIRHPFRKAGTKWAELKAMNVRFHGDTFTY